MCIRLVGSVRVMEGRREGIPTIEVFMGDYLRDWQIDDKWKKVEAEMNAAREKGVKVIEEKRTPDGRFRSYKVEATDAKVGRI